MKKIWGLAIFSIILVALLISAPVAAYSPPTPPPSPTVTYGITNGIEIFPGIAYKNIRYGATFVAQVVGTDGTNGVLSASVNYQGPNPATPSNTIVGGSWTLTVTTREKAGTIFGKIDNGGIIYWGTANTNSGHADMTLSITGGTGDYKTISGSGFFDGDDVHVPGITIFGVTIPTVDGTLYLYTK